MPRTYYVYIMASASRTLYIGVTNNLRRRVYEHAHKRVPGFTAKYNIARLVHFETTSSVTAALAREKQLKTWRRDRKLAFIETTNPGWRDLSTDWNDGPASTLTPS
jgi:putative endonuclease